MDDSAKIQKAFLAQLGWEDATRSSIAGDASRRHYTRLEQHSGHSAILMNAPPDSGEDVRPFIDIAQTMASYGLSVPNILGEDRENGFLLLEDLGDDLFAKVFASNPDLELPLYKSAVDILLSLRKHTVPPGLPKYDTGEMVEKAKLAYTHYAGSKTDSAQFRNLLAQALEQFVGPPDVIVHRDFHSENLIWLPNRKDLARVGILDFQDASFGHPAYDLVSLLEDARRDVSPDIQTQMLERYLEISGTPRKAFVSAYHVLGAQRNLRIIGIFARLCVEHGKSKYVDLIPRVWGHLLHDLDHSDLTGLRAQVFNDLPEPVPSVLEGLRARCSTTPTA